MEYPVTFWGYVELEKNLIPIPVVPTSFDVYHELFLQYKKDNTYSVMLWGLSKTIYGVQREGGAQ